MKLKYMMCVAVVSMLVGQMVVGQSTDQYGAEFKDPKVFNFDASKRAPTDKQPAASSNNTQSESSPQPTSPIVEGPQPSSKETK